MLFLGHYSVDVDKLEMAMAKRLEWDEVKPDGFRMVCDYVVLGKSAPFEGGMVIETANAEDLNTLILYYGETVKIDLRPASDVLSAIQMTRAAKG